MRHSPSRSPPRCPGCAGCDLAVHSAAHVAAVTSELNTRPRKTLSYATPAARYRVEARRPPLPITTVIHGPLLLGGGSLMTHVHRRPRCR